MRRNDKIFSQERLAERIASEKSNGKIAGFTNGCFDILHAGHVRYLRAAKNECDILVVGVNSDISVRSIKGENRPVNTEGDRAEVLAALECVDYVTLFSEDTPQALIEELDPDILFKGGDWKEDEIAGADHVKSRGGRVSIIGYEEGYSTTNIIKKMGGMTKKSNDK
ncbi:MAG: D-glycero-beta-D-manno-heptose 1-phosphate adenylyltransferase [Candidatus Omnitrophota bacterium]|nr:D-glycero-beta-D-manno-heptose 1-phosphate adenylyltransferase [Candidatus Omnitrophota bacterium]